MKPSGLFAGVTVAASLAVILGISLFSTYSLKPPSTNSIRPQQLAGQATDTLNSTFLEGGSLQQNLNRARPEEFIIEESGQDVPRFLTQEFTVHSNKVVSITLINQSTINQQHNWVLVQPGSQRKVAEAAMKAGPTWQWIPNSLDILAFVPLTQPGQSKIILFRAPKTPGDYPFLCTYPGHHEAMHGILHVLQ